MAVTPNLSAITNDINVSGGKIIQKNVNKLDILTTKGIDVYYNVSNPIPLTKLSRTGASRPYREQDDTSGNGVTAVPRMLSTKLAKYDFDVDVMVLWEKYLAAIAGNDPATAVDPKQVPFYDWILQVAMEGFAADINDSVIFGGVYNASGTTPAAIADGLRKLVDVDQALGTPLITVVTTGSPTSSNASDKAELMKAAAQPWFRRKGGYLFVPFDQFDNYIKHKRSQNAYQYDPSRTEEYPIDGSNFMVKAASWLPNGSDAMMLAAPGAIALGINRDTMKVSASMRRNIIEVRIIAAVGIQIADEDAVIVNDKFETPA